MNTDTITKRRGRPPFLTEEDKLRLRKIRNDNRGPQRHIWRECPICQIKLMSQNYNRHFLSQSHAQNVLIQNLKCQLEKEKNINI